MSKFKRGALVRVRNAESVCAPKETNGEVGMVSKVLSTVEYEVTFSRSIGGSPEWSYRDEHLEAANEPAPAPKGTLERLQIEALPQGGYKATEPGTSWGAQAADLAAFSTLAELAAFVSANMR